MADRSATAAADAFVRGSGLASTWRPVDAAEAAAIAQAHYGIAGAMTRFASEKDDTFRIRAAGGEAYVFKLCNPDEDAGAIDFQTALLDHVAAADPALPVPRALRAADGSAAPCVIDSFGQSRRLRLLTYLEGVPLDTLPATAGQGAAVGVTLARLRLSMADFAHPADAPDIAWDVRHTQRLAPLAAEIEEDDHRALVEAGFARLAPFAPAITALRRQVVHNDFSRSNVVVADDGRGPISGVIDFGDAGRTAIAIDVSTALLNHLPRQVSHRDDDIFAIGRALLTAYRSVADLTDAEIALLPHLVMARIVVRAVLSTWRARRLPDNATYILRNTAQGWGQLAWFLARSDDALSDLLLSTSGTRHD